MLDQRRNDLFRRSYIGQSISDDKGFEPCQCLEGHLSDLALVELLDVYAAAVRKRHCGCSKLSRIGDREIDLVLGRDPAFEGNTVRFSDGISMAMLDEIEPFFLLQRGLKVGRFAD